MAQCCFVESRFYEMCASVCHWPHHSVTLHLSPLSKVVHCLSSLTLGTSGLVYSGLTHNNVKAV